MKTSEPNALGIVGRHGRDGKRLGPWLSIGCRFDSPLTGDQALQLGMGAESLDEDGVAQSLDGSGIN